MGKSKRSGRGAIGRKGPPTRPASDKRPGKPRFMSSQRETFCRLVALRGYSQTDAYREAYQSSATDRTCATEASKLMADPEVAHRVEQLQRPELRREALSRDGHLEQLARLRDEAVGVGQIGPAVTAEMARGKVGGYYVERNLNADASLEQLVAGSYGSKPDAPAGGRPDGAAGSGGAGHDSPPPAKPRPTGARKPA